MHVETYETRETSEVATVFVISSAAMETNVISKTVEFDANLQGRFR